MNIEIKKLEKPIDLILEQYECKNCKKKIYINTEDKDSQTLICPYCKNQSENIRIFKIKINEIGEY
jgi:DNA-directed RNA polymerase subunit RPC12/RpoP